jgi:hypothetical protein
MFDNGSLLRKIIGVVYAAGVFFICSAIDILFMAGII